MHGQEFFAEVKNYAVVGDQPGEYEEYLAKCYRAYSLMPARCDHFMWLTWHPFSQSKWPQLCSVESVTAAVTKFQARCGGENPDSELCKQVADRLWLIVLSSKQEGLTIESEDLDLVISRQRARLAAFT